MADEFDSFLAAALAPPEREADRHFVARVRARVALDAYLRAERKSALGMFGKQVLALVAIGTAIAWLARSAGVASLLTRGSGAGLILVLAAFAFVTLLLVPRGGTGRSFTKLNGS